MKKTWDEQAQTVFAQGCNTYSKRSDQFVKGVFPTHIENFNGIECKIKADGKGKKYDCVIGVSGGTDSSFMVWWAVQNGLRPLAVHYDNTWNTSIATENIRKVLGKLNVDLFTHVCDNKEADDIFKAFFIALA